jgi:hypothetical protein
MFERATTLQVSGDTRQAALDEGPCSDGLPTTERGEFTRLRRENRVLREGPAMVMVSDGTATKKARNEYAFGIKSMPDDRQLKIVLKRI